MLGAARADHDPWQVPALEAVLDALVASEMPGLGEAQRDAALAHRTASPAVIVDGLTRAQSGARGPFARALVARSLMTLAEWRGDAAEAERQRAATGCVREAVVLGPTTWAPILGVLEAGPLDAGDARLEPAYTIRQGAFDVVIHPIAVRARGCAIELAVEGSREGVREVAFDVVIPRAQTIGLALRAHGAAVLRAGGNPVLSRPFEAGDGDAARFARVSVEAGTVRFVARVGTALEDDSVEIDVTGEDGAPLSAAAPAIASSAPFHVTGAEPLATPAPRDDDELLLAAEAALASGDPREAERVLWAAATRRGARPDLSLVYARAIDHARDLSAATRAERARSAYEQTLAGWPGSWEATIAHAVLAGVRRGRDEADLEALRDLALQTKPGGAHSAVVDAFEAVTAGRARLFDRAQAALDRARGQLAGTALLADAEDASTPRVGPERAVAACDLGRPLAHDTLSCFDALRDAGDRVGQARELARLAGAVGATRGFPSIELREAVAVGDATAAARVFAGMLPAERTLGGAAELSMLSAEPAPDRAKRLIALAATARDAPGALAPLLSAAGDDPGRELDPVADRISSEDRAHPVLASAATAVLAHRERYDVSPDGLTHWVLFDVRRVSGTTDVEENAQAPAPELWGRAAARALRRRIFKRDGRVLEPDRAPHASQAHADLSQLEQGDIVEAVYEGWCLPSDTGDLGIDSPDLLPERTAVADATIELSMPASLKGALWSHPLLGNPVERLETDAGSARRVVVWHMSERPARRVEDSVPKMDRNVGVSFSTAQWSGMARALRETVAALNEHDPEIGAWARAATANAGVSPRARVEAITTAAGSALREADPGTLSDFGGGTSPVQTQTARSFLSSHDGSRSWLVLRGLRELGIGADLVVAENAPFSADPAFPPHYGRFVHPLVVAHITENGHPEDVWIDADVSGPPLPAGRVSPELRGRLALRSDGTVTALDAAATGRGERDEIDIRLALDAQGNARGTFAIVLRGREAQELAEALVRVVGAERQRALREVVLAWLPWANVDDVQLASSDGSWQVSLRADVSVSGYAQAEGKAWLLPGLDPLHAVWPRARVSTLAATFATRAGRESALALSAAVQYHVHRRVELPPGDVVTRVPGPLEVSARLVDASRKMTIEKSAIEDDFVLGVATGTVSPAEYNAFVAAAHRADDGFLAGTRVAAP